jgi:thiol-disulfide isomerase/thioredoxin
MQGRFNKLIDAKIAEREEVAAPLARGSAPVPGGLASFLRDREQKLESTPPDYLPWQAFSRNRLQLLKDHGYTVLIDFTANWCPTCQTNKRFVLNTEEIRRAIDANNVVTLIADMSDEQPEIKKLLEELGNRGHQIPYYAVYPAGRPNEPILFGELISKQQVLTALQLAGPSKPKDVEQVRTATELERSKPDAGERAASATTSKLERKATAPSVVTIGQLHPASLGNPGY